MPAPAALTAPCAFAATAQRGHAQDNSLNQPSQISNFIFDLQRRARIHQERSGSSRPALTPGPPQRPPATSGPPQAPATPGPPRKPPDASGPKPTTLQEDLPRAGYQPAPTRFGVAEDTSALRERYPSYDAGREPSYTDLRKAVRRRPSARPDARSGAPARTEDPYDEEFDSPAIVNPFRSAIYQPNVTQGRFGTSQLDLNAVGRYDARASREPVFQSGGLTMRMGLIGGLDYTDNALFTADNKIDDFIGRVAGRFSVNYQITRQNAFNLNLGISYRQYLLNPEVNDIIRDAGFRADVTPGSRVSFDSN
ncbi:MAG: hypothetical protein ACC661_11100, partial [Verrucomicrobiales bacterium]